MAVSIEIVLTTWLVAASLASLLALLVSRASGVIEPPERPKDELCARRKGELVEPPEQPEGAEWQVVIVPPERPKDELNAERCLAFYVTCRAGRRVHTSKTCRGLRNAKEISMSPKNVVGKTHCKICFRNE